MQRLEVEVRIMAVDVSVSYPQMDFQSMVPHSEIFQALGKAKEKYGRH